MLTPSTPSDEDFASREEAKKAFERNLKIAQEENFDIKPDAKIHSEDIRIAEEFTRKILNQDENEDVIFWKTMFYKQKGITDSLLKRLEKYESN